MAVYAAAEDISDLYGTEELIRASDLDRDGSADTATVDRAIADASATIDVYVGKKYALPLSVTTPVLKRLCVDIALYRMVLTAGVWTEEHRVRYDDALQMLKDIAEGKATLGVATTGEGDEAETALPSTSGVLDLQRG